MRILALLALLFCVGCEAAASEPCSVTIWRKSPGYAFQSWCTDQLQSWGDGVSFIDSKTGKRVIVAGDFYVEFK